MVYSDSTNDSGIVEDARWLVGANTATYKIADITRNINRWLDKAVATIIPASNMWQFDDSNYTDYPIATTALVSGQTDYVFDVSFLRIERVEIKDENDNWTRLRQIDRTDVAMAMSEFQEEDGIPFYYDVSANSVKLYAASDYSQAASLKVYFQRKGSYFDKTDTTKEPGFAEIFHRYLSLGAAYDYSLKNKVSNRDELRAEIVQMESDIEAFYARRNKDIKNRMTVTRPLSK